MSPVESEMPAAMPAFLSGMSACSSSSLERKILRIGDPFALP
jgi:hypothetical protein